MTQHPPHQPRQSHQPRLSRRPRPPGWAVRLASTVLTAAVGLVWLIAGLLKVADPAGMERSVRAFRILPEVLVEPVAYGLPFVEIALGVLLFISLTTRLSALVSAVLFAVYIGAIASAAARGLRIDCGCFSTGGDLAAGAPTHYTEEIVRDSLLLLASLFLVWRPNGYLTVDGLIRLVTRARTRPTTTDHHPGGSDGLAAEEAPEEPDREEPGEGPDEEPGGPAGTTRQALGETAGLTRR